MKAAEQSCNIEPINNLNFEAQVLRSQRPVLLLCMTNQEMLPGQIEVLRQTIENNYNSDIRVCLLEEEFIHAFKQMYHIVGMPIFLLFDGGKEIGRMLGVADSGHLHAFLARYFPDAEDISGEEFVWG